MPRPGHGVGPLLAQHAWSVAACPSVLGTVVVYTCGPSCLINSVPHVAKDISRGLRQIHLFEKIQEGMGEVLWAAQPEGRNPGMGSLCESLGRYGLGALKERIRTRVQSLRGTFQLHLRNGIFFL